MLTQSFVCSHLASRGRGLSCFMVPFGTARLGHKRRRDCGQGAEIDEVLQYHLTSQAEINQQHPPTQEGLLSSLELFLLGLTAPVYTFKQKQSALFMEYHTTMSLLKSTVFQRIANISRSFETHQNEF